MVLLQKVYGIEFPIASHKQNNIFEIIKITLRKYIRYKTAHFFKIAY